VIPHAGVEQRGFGDGPVVVVALLAEGDAGGLSVGELAR
jgi:hypothetical protein